MRSLADCNAVDAGSAAIDICSKLSLRGLVAMDDCLGTRCLGRRSRPDHFRLLFHQLAKCGELSCDSPQTKKKIDATCSPLICR